MNYILRRLKQIFWQKDKGLKYKLCVLYLAVTRFINSALKEKITYDFTRY